MVSAVDGTGATLAGFDYDNLGHPAGIQYAGSAANTVALSWSNEGDLLTLAHALSGTDSVSYTDAYTPAHQIASSSVSNGIYQYVPQVSGTDAYVPNALNQYASIAPAGGTATSIGYDLKGNLTSDGAFVFAYDAENKLIAAAKTGTAVSYAYDPLGRRDQKTVNGVATYFLSADADEIAEYDGAGTLLRRYIPGPAIDRPVAMVDAAGAKTYFHQDKTGSVIAMSDASGNKTEGPYTYDSFGNGAPYAGVPYKFAGRRLDPETGLYYYRARYYTSALGRFLQTDAIGYTDDINWYTYVANDPTDKTDPTGMAFGLDDLAGLVVGGLVGAGVEVTKDVITGEQITVGGVAGAAFAGGVVGVGAVNAPETGGISFAAAVGFVAGAGGDAIKQAVDIKTGDQKEGFSVKEVAVDGAVGAAVGGVTEGVLPNAKIPGLSSGRGNMNAVAKGVRTRIANGTAKNMSAKAAVKAAVGSQAAGAFKTVGGAAADAAKGEVCSSDKRLCR